MRNAIAAGIIAAVFGGCGMGPEYTAQQCPPGYAPAPAAPAPPVATVYANPIFIPIADSQCAWETIVDVVDDYFRIDNGYVSHLTGYENGDFDYSGRIDADDYFIIDRNYSRQGTTFASAASIGGTTAVPEPAGVAVLAVAATLMGRRRRSR